ncbi:hypothetical protein FALBO_5944 [Fusarium albosuccineum]|uniref:Uncharacterized protein n=1 Tax=Fusarium albosuccineum TaxID=1237068 RepID=A0A8H4PF20_9HYPO|nr:hypothetical protein FALBO_5944 [Fusarium albosuccineum]
MLLNGHFHALALECQGDAPDDREADPGQKGAVTFHMLKVMDSYHDNIEHLNITKWMTQLSVEIGLPPWLEFELMEICICEAIKNAWHTPFNRYSWIVEREYSKGQKAYHSDHNDQEFWNDNLNYIIEAARRLTDPKKGKLRSVQQAETWLGFATDKLTQRLKAWFTEVCDNLRKEFEKDNSILSKSAQVREAVKGRKQKRHQLAVDRGEEQDDEPLGPNRELPPEEDEEPDDSFLPVPEDQDYTEERLRAGAPAFGPQTQAHIAAQAIALSHRNSAITDDDDGDQIYSQLEGSRELTRGNCVSIGL